MEVLEQLRRLEHESNDDDLVWANAVHDVASDACRELPDVAEAWRYRARFAWLLGMMAVDDDAKQTRFTEVAEAAHKLQELGDDFGAETAWVDVGAYGVGESFFGEFDERYGVVERLRTARFYQVVLRPTVSVLSLTRLPPADPRYVAPQ